MTHQINYSFYLGFEPDILYFVNVPLSMLEGKELNLDTVRTVVEEDQNLILELLGPDMLRTYEQFCLVPHLYQKELQRFDESIRLVEVKQSSPAEALDKRRVESALREFIGGHVDYDLHKNFESDEETGADSYSALAEKFVKIYNKQQ